MAISTDLSEDNPWWKSSELIEKDPKVMEWENSFIKWEPRISHTFTFTDDLMYSLRGPRQIGKTTLIKLQIRKLLKQGISPWNIMYYAFDIDNTPRSLVEKIKNYLDNTTRQRKGNRCFLFLDEVSSIKDWQKGIKRLWDQQKLKNCTVIATGSHTVDLKLSTEKLPGRRGDTNDALDKIMLPMKFSEYVSILDPALKKIIDDGNLLHANPRLKVAKNLMNSEIDNILIQIQSYLPELNRYLIDYLITGGVPRIVNEYAEKGIIEEGVYTTYLDAILGDLHALNRNESIFRQLIQNVIKSIGWTSSWRSLQKNTDIGTQSTVSQYIDTLENMFILSVFYQYDSKSKRGLFRKEKKIHFHDPSYYHILSGWQSGLKSFDVCKKILEDPIKQGALVEGVIGDHLIRLAFNISPKKQNFVYSNVLYYWRYGKDKEVDYVYNDGMGREIPIEVKFQNNLSVRDLDGIINFKKFTGVKNALLISKDKLELTRECVVIPASIFLLLI